MELTAVLTPAEEGGYVAFNPETGTTTEGECIEEFPAGVKGHPLSGLLRQAQVDVREFLDCL